MFSFASSAQHAQSASAQQKSRPIPPSFRIGQQPTTTDNNSIADSLFPRCAAGSSFPCPGIPKPSRRVTKGTKWGQRSSARTQPGGNGQAKCPHWDACSGPRACQAVPGEVQQDHLAGYDPSTAPKFTWPERLVKARDEIRQKAQQRSRAEGASDPAPPKEPGM
jgi:hypothetical protein